MKPALCALLGLSLLAGLASPAEAAARKKKHRYDATEANRTVEPRSGYHEHISDRLPFGSKLWWEQMLRERRGGRAG